MKVESLVKNRISSHKATNQNIVNIINILKFVDSLTWARYTLEQYPRPSSYWEKTQKLKQYSLINLTKSFLYTYLYLDISIYYSCTVYRFSSELFCLDYTGGSEGPGCLPASNTHSFIHYCRCFHGRNILTLRPSIQLGSILVGT